MQERITAVLAAAAISSAAAGQCDPLFEPQRTFDAGSSPTWAGAADFDEDGAVDLVFGSTARLAQVLIGDGNGGFEPGEQVPISDYVIDLAVADFDDDGHADFATVDYRASELDIRFGNGDGTFAAEQSEPAGTGIWKVAGGDLNGDGVADLAGASLAGAVVIVISNGDGTFQPARQIDIGFADGINMPIVLGDLDADGDLDVVVIAPYMGLGDDLRVLLNRGDATFEPVLSYSISGQHQTLAMADFDGDGDDDLVLPFVDACVMLSNGDGTFADPACNPVGAEPFGTLATDIDGDGHPDIVTVNRSSDDVSVLLGRGDGTFEPHRTSAVNDSPLRAIDADFDGDGFADLAVAHSETPNDVSVLMNACGCVADMDGDGDADIEDFFTFLDHFADGDGRADVNDDGDIDIEDFFFYLDAFAQGCA